MSRRGIIAARRRRERRELLAKAEREAVVGGPLVNIDAPILSGGSEYQHEAYVQDEMWRRAVVAQREAWVLAVWFAHRCLLLRAERVRMVVDLGALLGSIGGPYLKPNYSTAVTAKDRRYTETVVGLIEEGHPKGVFDLFGTKPIPPLND